MANVTKIRKILCFQDLLETARKTDYEMLVRIDGFENALYELRAMWTWYCDENDLECDTATYDSQLGLLWGTLKANHGKAFLLHDFEDFDRFMCEDLV